MSVVSDDDEEQRYNKKRGDLLAWNIVPLEDEPDAISRKTLDEVLYSYSEMGLFLELDDVTISTRQAIQIWMLVECSKKKKLPDQLKM